MEKVLTFYDKLKLWAASAGLRSLAYLGAGVFALLFMSSWFLFGIGLGIFGADNWVTIKELINTQVKKFE